MEWSWSGGKGEISAKEAMRMVNKVTKGLTRKMLL